jgi:hypothetical protein
MSAAPLQATQPAALARWTAAVQIRPVSTVPDHHTIHSYFTASPESPDGRWVLFYASATPEGYTGELRIQERATGAEQVLVRSLTVEDAHRAACQQWVCGGRFVVFHAYRNGEWVVAAVDVETGEERVLARGRQAGWGRPDSPVVPVYGPHWAPGPYRDLELLHVETGELCTALTAAAVRHAYPDEVAQEFGDRPISIFFPILSPDGTRVLFKLATPAGGDFRSPQASHRELLIGYDLAAARFLFIRRRWGHPAWHPDSRRIINVPLQLIDSNTGIEHPIPGLPAFPGAHPAVSPDGRLLVTDTHLEPFGGPAGHWGVVVADLCGHASTILHRFENRYGARSWRVSHPHPVFSPDGQRIYFNVSATGWTQLYLAETAG